jgi:hypothetical protein
MANLSLLSMPREIRDKVLRNCLVIGLAFRYPDRRAYTCRNFKSPDTSTQILRVCKTLYEEALPILYGANILCFNDLKELKQFLSYSSHDVEAMIHHIYMRNQRGLANNLSMLSILPNLRSLHVLSTGFIPYGDQRSIADYLNDSNSYATKLVPAKTFIQQITRHFSQIEIGVVYCLPQKENRIVSIIGGPL